MTSPEPNMRLKALRGSMPFVTPDGVGKIGCSQTEAAYLLGVGLRTYQRWESGEIEAPRMAMIVMGMASNNELPAKYVPWL